MADGVRVADAVPLTEDVSLRVPDSVAEGESDCDGVAVRLPVRVNEGLCDCDWLRVNVEVGVLVPDGDAVIDAVSVADALWVGDFVTD